MCDLEVEFVNPSREGILSGSWNLLNRRIIRSSLGAGAAWPIFLDGPRGTSAGDDLGDIILNLFLWPACKGAMTLKGN